jgi:hypothetical protein
MLYIEGDVHSALGTGVFAIKRFQESPTLLGNFDTLHYQRHKHCALHLFPPSTSHIPLHELLHLNILVWLLLCLCLKRGISL